jgi:hypothetical protein
VVGEFEEGLGLVRRSSDAVLPTVEEDPLIAAMLAQVMASIQESDA